MDPAEIEQLIRAALPDAEVSVSTRTDHPEDDHYEATVVSPAFEGLSLVDQHEAVYDALGEAMTDEIHALELDTRAPSTGDD